MGGVPVAGAQYGADPRGLEPVFEVVGLQLIGGGNGDGPQLVQPQNRRPEFPVPLQHQHHPVALFHAQGFKVIGRLGGKPLHVLEGKFPLLLMLVQMQHGQLVRVFVRQRIHHVEGEVELILPGKLDALQGSVLAHPRVHKLFAHQVLGLAGHHQAVPNLRLGHFLSRQHHRQEHAVLPVHGDHPVGRGGIIENAVSFVQQLHMVAHLHLQRAGNDQVEFLAGMGGHVNGPVLQLRQIVVFYPIGLGHLPPEHGGQVLNLNAPLPGGGHAPALAGHGVTGKVRAVSLQQVGNLNAEGQGAFVNERKGQIHRAGFICRVRLRAHLGLFRHLGLGQPHNFAHLPNAQRDFHQRILRSLHV